MRVLKYGLADYGPCYIEIPDGSRIIHIDNQQGALQLWAEVPAGTETILRAFHVIYTGDEVPESGTWVGTTLTYGGNLVRHVYELKIAHIIVQERT